MLDMIYQGGYLMIPIGICSVLAVAFTIERWFFLRKELGSKDDFWDSVEESLHEGNWEEALQTARSFSGYLPEIVEEGLKTEPTDPKLVKENMEDYGMKVRPDLERFLPALNFIAQVSPLLGLLGTVAGMIRTFSAIAQGGVGKPELLAGGISQALVTTASGLTVGIIALFFHHLISRKVDGILHDLKLAVRRVEGVVSDRINEREN